MLKNGRDIAQGSTLTAQVCVIGSGPAGITAAWELQKAGINVILIEGSRAYTTYEESWPDKYLLYNGQALGQFLPVESEFLVLPYLTHPDFPRERERMFGGTSTHWGGQTRPEDPIDLEARPPYFPGWPVTRDDLDPFYAQASRLCHLHGEYDRGRNYSNEFWSKELSADVPELPGFDVEMYQFIGPRYLNFATRTFDGGTTIADSAAQVIVNASLLDIDRSGRRVNGLRVASMDDSIPPKKATEFTIKADAYVLACGAVANARQLLLGNIGNEYDLVGRYFMAHALTQGSNVVSQTAYLDDSQTRYMAGHLPGNVRWTDRAGVGVNARFIPSAETTRKWPDTQTPPPPH